MTIKPKASLVCPNPVNIFGMTLEVLLVLQFELRTDGAPAFIFRLEPFEVRPAEMTSDIARASKDVTIPCDLRILYRQSKGAKIPCNLYQHSDGLSHAEVAAKDPLALGRGENRLPQLLREVFGLQSSWHGCSSVTDDLGGTDSFDAAVVDDSLDSSRPTKPLCLDVADERHVECLDESLVTHVLMARPADRLSRGKALALQLAFKVILCLVVRPLLPCFLVQPSPQPGLESVDSLSYLSALFRARWISLKFTLQTFDIEVGADRCRLFLGESSGPAATPVVPKACGFTNDLLLGFEASLDSPEVNTDVPA